MRWSNALIPTLKETPADAVAPSHSLLLRAGMVRQLGAGTYTYLPLGFRVLNKAIQIVREEMDAAGAQELLMPAVHPVELWQESNRFGIMGEILMKLNLSGEGGGPTHVLGPTHEEVITDVARDLIKSYKQLPLTLYQIQTKFRNEARPRFGILRTREFLMKDAYSFDADVAQLNQSYDAMYEAYCRIFDRCGFPYVAVEAESGPIGGDASHEFMVPCAIGEDVVIHCAKCSYAANREKAEIGQVAAAAAGEAAPYQEVATPGRKTIREVCEFLKLPEARSAKFLIYMADDRPIGALVRGDHELNEAKLRRVSKAERLVPADPGPIEKIAGASIGSIGPINLAQKIAVYMDRSVAALADVVVGANREGFHLTGVVPARDLTHGEVHDLRNAEKDDPCPRCGSAMELSQGIEIGHVFKLGTKYSDALNATFLNDKGAAVPLIMGCYGIGVNRILAAAVETGHDANGIIWPLNLAPYEVVLVPLQVQNAAVMEAAALLEQQFTEAGVDVLVDDREQRPGVKFKDADLIGIPLRVVVGERGLKDGTIEVKWRTDEAAHTVPAANAGETILAELQARHAAIAEKCNERRAERAASRNR